MKQVPAGTGLVEPGADLSWMRSTKIRRALSSENHVWTGLEILVYRGTRFSTKGGCYLIPSLRLQGKRRWQPQGSKWDASRLVSRAAPLGQEFFPGAVAGKGSRWPHCSYSKSSASLPKAWPAVSNPPFLIGQPCADYILPPPSLLLRTATCCPGL